MPSRPDPLGPEGARFWASLDALVASATLIIDRPCGSAHPRFPAFLYPLDYGYLEGTSACDGGGIDVWVGSLQPREVVGVLACADLAKRDAEIKILLGCSREEALLALRTHNTGPQGATLIWRAAPCCDLARGDNPGERRQAPPAPESTEDSGSDGRP
jgi:inorganic pyrophosphatase